jgi:hypothetical protein
VKREPTINVRGEDRKHKGREGMGHGDWGWGALPLPWWKMFIFNIYLLPK